MDNEVCLGKHEQVVMLGASRTGRETRNKAEDGGRGESHTDCKQSPYLQRSVSYTPHSFNLLPFIELFLYAICLFSDLLIRPQLPLSLTAGDI